MSIGKYEHGMKLANATGSQAKKKRKMNLKNDLSKALSFSDVFFCLLGFKIDTLSLP